MAYGTLRKAYLNWQALNGRLEAAGKDLTHQYLALLHRAEDCRIDPQSGLLRTAAAALHHSPDPQILQLQDRLNNGFAILGKSFFRHSPTSLQLDIFRFADRIQEICRQFDHLGAKLRIAQNVFDTVQANQSISKQYLNMALVNPEVVWVSLLLQQRCLLTRQAIELSLTHSWQTSYALCQRFLKLLHPLLPPKSFRDLQKSLTELEDQTTSQPQSSPCSLAAQCRLDQFTDLAQQLASEIIASQSGLK
jgi:hypothetical protein